MGVIVNVFQSVEVLSWCTFHIWTRPGYGSFLTLACLMAIFDIFYEGWTTLFGYGYMVHLAICITMKRIILWWWDSTSVYFWSLTRINVLLCVLFVEWLKYCRNAVKHQVINQYTNLSVTHWNKMSVFILFSPVMLTYFFFFFFFVVCFEFDFDGTTFWLISDNKILYLLRCHFGQQILLPKKSVIKSTLSWKEARIGQLVCCGLL